VIGVPGREPSSPQAAIEMATIAAIEASATSSERKNVFIETSARPRPMPLSDCRARP